MKVSDEKENNKSVELRFNEAELRKEKKKAIKIFKSIDKYKGYERLYYYYSYNQNKLNGFLLNIWNSTQNKTDKIF